MTATEKWGKKGGKGTKRRWKEREVIKIRSDSKLRGRCQDLTEGEKE